MRLETFTWTILHNISLCNLLNSKFHLFLSSIPLLLSVWTIDLAFLWVFSYLVWFLFICHVFFCFCVYLCTWGVRELTLLFSHLQRQRNNKKVLPNSYHTLLSGLRPYSSPYLSGDRYALRHLTQPHSTSRQVAKVYLHSHSHTHSKLIEEHAQQVYKENEGWASGAFCMDVLRI